MDTPLDKFHHHMFDPFLAIFVAGGAGIAGTPVNSHYAADGTEAIFLQQIIQ